MLQRKREKSKMTKIKMVKVDKNETYFCEGEKESDTAGSREGVADLALDLLRTEIYILLKQSAKRKNNNLILIKSI